MVVWELAGGRESGMIVGQLSVGTATEGWVRREEDRNGYREALTWDKHKT